MEHFLHLKGTLNKDEKALVRMEIGLLLKEKCTYLILIGAFIRCKRGHFEKGETFTSYK